MLVNGGAGLSGLGEVIRQEGGKKERGAACACCVWCVCYERDVCAQGCVSVCMYLCVHARVCTGVGKFVLPWKIYLGKKVMDPLT